MYRVSSFQLQGPFEASGIGSTPSRDRIFSCHPNNGVAPAACAEEIIRNLATRAYRRPVSAQDVSELLAYYEDGVKEGTFEAGIRSAVTGILASPFFLYRAERNPTGLRSGETYTIDSLELAGEGPAEGGAAAKPAVAADDVPQRLRHLGRIGAGVVEQLVPGGRPGTGHPRSSAA